MQYGICALSIVPVRFSPDHQSEMVSQILYGEHFKILEQRKHWSKIRIALDGCEGWAVNNQMHKISENDYKEIESGNPNECSTDLISHVETGKNILVPIVLGSTISNTELLQHKFEGGSVNGLHDKSNLINMALLYLNTPYLWGGRTPFGIDAAGFVQMVYKLHGCNLHRKAQEQSTVGTALSFIEESEAGDLAFFDNSEGIIDHVGLIMDNNYIIHVNGKVRIDRLDHTGIFNAEEGNYTHNLRVIKKVI